MNISNWCLIQYEINQNILLKHYYHKVYSIIKKNYYNYIAQIWNDNITGEKYTN